MVHLSLIIAETYEVDFRKIFSKENHTHKTRDVQNHNLHHDDRRPKDGVRIAASIENFSGPDTWMPSLYLY